MGTAHKLWSIFLGFTYLGLCFLWIFPLYGSFFIFDDIRSQYGESGQSIHRFLNYIGRQVINGCLDIVPRKYITFLRTSPGFSSCRFVQEFRTVRSSGMNGTTPLSPLRTQSEFAFAAPLSVHLIVFSTRAARFYAEASFCCVWLMPPALLYSAHGLANDLKARWPKILPVCIFGVTVMLMSFINNRGLLLNHIPPQVVVAGIVSSVGAILFSDRYGQLAGAVCLCIMAAGFTWL